MAGIPNTLNVVSNIAFVIAAAYGLAVIRKPRRFVNALERQDAIAFFLGTFLTAVGSTIYHLDPNDATLVYDRAGMIVAFMAFLAMVIHERHDGARWLLPLLIVVGAASVWWWVAFGDLRLYAWVQFFPVLTVIAIVALDAPRHTREASALTVVVIAYALAKLFETFDRQTYDALRHVVSGHTLKHLAAGVAPLAIAVWIARRETVP